MTEILKEKSEILKEKSEILKEKLDIIKNCVFSDYSTNEKIVSVENLLEYPDFLDKTLYYEAISIIGYYFGKTHQYDKSQYWLNKLPEEQFNNNWQIFKKMLFPIILSSEEEENIVVQTLKNNLDTLCKLEKIYISNLLILDHSFWYGYIDNNPIEIYKKYVELQSKAFPSIYSQKLINYNIKNSKIKIGIISAGLVPNYNLNACNIHSSSISDSFYSTFLNLSNELFEVIFIYYGKDNDFKDDKNIYIPKLQPVVEEIQKVQRMKLIVK